MDKNIEVRNLKFCQDEAGTLGSVGSVTELYWLKGDKGLWDGPLMDWRNESHLWMKDVRLFDTVLQAGGACGMYARFYSDYFNHVISFEPDLNNYNILKMNCQGDQYSLNFGGLGNHNSHNKKYKLNKSHYSNLGMHTISDIPGEVPMFAIDFLNLTSLDLLHLDCEGYEENILKGGRETINHFNPVIIVERNKGGNLLSSWGYKCTGHLRMDSVWVKKIK